MITDSRHARTLSQRERRPSALPTHKPSASEGAALASIKVISRFRPMLAVEAEEIQNGRAWNAASAAQGQITVDQRRDDPLVFSFDYTFDSSATQEELFAVAGAPLVADVFAGYNATIFAYGPTGSGKTFTMVGGDLYDLKLRGLVPRCGSEIFQSIANADPDRKFTLTCAVLEIYRERLRDLLKVDNQELKVKESPDRGVYVDKLTTVNVANEGELLDVFELGTKMKTVAATKLNQMSSRSHSLFMIELTQQVAAGNCLRGNLNLVDLAGSEKVSKAETTGVTFEETKKINLSLSALGNVIHALSNGASHVPYRDSKLTRLLQDSLGGNYKTSLVVNCSSYSGNLEEIVSTLRFAQRAKKVKNKARQNIRKDISLEDEVNSLRLQLEEAFGQLEQARLPSACTQTKLLETEIDRNQMEILQLKAEETRLKKELLLKRERCATAEINQRLAELKHSNQDKVLAHLKFKSQVLLKQCAATEAIAASAENDYCSVYGSSTTYKSVRFDIDRPLSGLETDELVVTQPDKELAVIQAVNAQLETDLKLVQWEIFTEYVKNKQLSLVCTQQQGQMRTLEEVIEKLRKHQKLLRNSLYRKEDAPFSFSDDQSKERLTHLESSLDVLKTQVALTELCVQQQTSQHSQQKTWIADLEATAEDLLKANIADDEKLTALYDDAAAELAGTEREISTMQALLLALVEKYMKMQQDCGFPTDTTQKALEALRTASVGSSSEVTYA